MIPLFLAIMLLAAIAVTIFLFESAMRGPSRPPAEPPACDEPRHAVPLGVQEPGRR